ncbi:FAFR296Cp [Eremothecium gossypii FDAG1]|nr:FAFR296Cp [Eremothecium gossypii FDAG1]
MSVPYIPEYSSELRTFVQETYEQQVQELYPRLRFEKLVDLLERAANLFESYQDLVREGQTREGLMAYVIGAFYLYLIIPQSIEFHTRNLSYSLYTDLRKHYEREPNMTNVVQMVTEKVDAVLLRQTPEDGERGDTKLYRKRAYSVPEKGVARSSDSLQHLTVDGKRRGGHHAIGGAIPEVAVQADTLWSAPKLEENDLLRTVVSVSRSPSVSLSRPSSRGGDFVENALDGNSTKNGGRNTSKREGRRNSRRSDRSGRRNDGAKQRNGRSPNRSRSRGRSRSRVRNRSRSQTRIGGPTSDMADAKERGRTRSRSWSRSGSRSPSYSIRSTGGSRSPSRSPSRSASRSPIRGRSRSRSGSRTPELGSATASVHSWSYLQTTGQQSRWSVLPNDLPNAGQNKYNQESAVSFEQQELDRPHNSRVEPYNPFANGNAAGLEPCNPLTRLYETSSIKCSDLMIILESDIQDRVLFIDLRPPKRYELNHIVARHLINIDPLLLWDTERSAPITSVNEFERRLDNPLFTTRGQFSYLVCYTDNHTSMNMDFKFELTFFELVYMGKPRLLTKCLQGGYDQWRLYLKTNTKSIHAKISDFMWRANFLGRDTSVSDHNPFRATPPVPTARPPVPPLPTAPPPVAPYISSPRPVPFIPLQQPSLSLLHTSANIVKPGKAELRNELSRITGQIDHTQYNQPEKYRYLPDSRESPYPIEYEDPKHTERSRGWLSAGSSEAHFSVPTIEKNPNEYIALSITGLRNMSNTCYINSMLQCLFSTTEFRNLFLSNKYSRYLKSSNMDNMSRSFYMLFKKMYMNGGCSVVPSGFLKMCSYLKPDLRIPHGQQDTQEFLLFLLDRLRDELSYLAAVVNDYPQLLLHESSVLKVNDKEYTTWFDQNFEKNGLSPIDSIFQGQIEHQLSCQRCDFSSYSYSTFYVLSLALPNPGSKAFGKAKKLRLEDCINFFTCDEVLTGQNAWDCPKCGVNSSGDRQMNSEKSKRKNKFFMGSENANSANSNRDHLPRLFKIGSKSRSRSSSPFISGPKSSGKTHEKRYNKKLATIKSLNFITLPRILIIHLSRFVYDLTKKNNTVVTYPLILNIVLKNNEVAKYRLYSTINHFGTLISGHYTSLVNKDLQHEIREGKQKWYYFDDEIVKLDPNHGNYDRGITSVSSSDVYLLFYERIS